MSSHLSGHRLLGSRTKVLRAAAVAGGVIAAGAGHAHAASVACNSGGSISAAVAKLKPATGYVTLGVSGACSDNIYIPPNLAVNLVGAKGASLTAAVAGNPAINVQGRLILQTMTVSSTSFATVYVAQGGFATLQADTVSGAGAMQVAFNAGAQIQNSTLTVTSGTTAPAIQIYAGGTLEIDGDAPIGAVKGSTVQGINCGGGGTVSLGAYGGPVTISGSPADGIYGSGCTITAVANAGETLSISDNKGRGVNSTGGTVNLVDVTISGNGNNGIQAGNAAALTLTGSTVSNNSGFGIFATTAAGVSLPGGNTISGNGSNAMAVQVGAVLTIFNYTGGVNMITEASGNTNVLFSCYQGGKVYVNQINGYITPAPTAADIGCLQVGGP